MSNHHLVIDRGDLNTVERTPSGGYVVSAIVSKCGVFTYYDNGRPVRVLRSPERVFSAESLASLARCPVTVGHPSEGSGLVNGENYKQLAVGWLESPTRMGDKISARLVIQDAKAGERVLSRLLCEVSCGYVSTKEGPAGVHPLYGPYD